MDLSSSWTVEIFLANWSSRLAMELELPPRFFSKPRSFSSSPWFPISSSLICWALTSILPSTSFFITFNLSSNPLPRLRAAWLDESSRLFRLPSMIWTFSEIWVWKVANDFEFAAFINSISSLALRASVCLSFSIFLVFSIWMCIDSSRRMTFSRFDLKSPSKEDTLSAIPSELSLIPFILRPISSLSAARSLFNELTFSPMFLSVASNVEKPSPKFFSRLRSFSSNPWFPWSSSFICWEDTFCFSTRSLISDLVSLLLVWLFLAIFSSDALNLSLIWMLNSLNFASILECLTSWPSTVLLSPSRESSRFLILSVFALIFFSRSVAWESKSWELFSIFLSTSSFITLNFSESPISRLLMLWFKSAVFFSLLSIFPFKWSNVSSQCFICFSHKVILVDWFVSWSFCNIAVSFISLISDTCSINTFSKCLLVSFLTDNKSWVIDSILSSISESFDFNAVTFCPTWFSRSINLFSKDWLPWSRSWIVLDETFCFTSKSLQSSCNAYIFDLFCWSNFSTFWLKFSFKLFVNALSSWIL